jgi:hypothetical protein
MRHADARLLRDGIRSSSDGLACISPVLRRAAPKII